MKLIDPKDTATLKAFLNDQTLRHGVGDDEEMCSIAALNLAITGKITDEPLPCVSGVIREWVIVVQDRMPVDMINTPEWKSALALVAGTGQDHEKARSRVALDWVWVSVLPQLQGIADNNRFGEQWRDMCRDKTQGRALVSKYAAEAASYAAEAASYAAEAASYAASYAAEAASYAAEAASYYANATTSRACNASHAAYASALAASYAAETAAETAVRAANAATCKRQFWEKAAPVECLNNMIALGDRTL